MKYGIEFRIAYGPDRTCHGVLLLLLLPKKGWGGRDAGKTKNPIEKLKK